MKKIVLIFFISYLFGLEIVVDTAKEYSVLTMNNNTPFACKQKDSNTYICKFFRLPSTPVFATNTLNFKIKPFFEKDNFFIKIKVKNKSIIKSFKKNLYEGYDKRLKHLKLAKKWVIIAYKNKIPFLTNKPIKGLKIPLQVNTDFYLKAIDANGNPVDYDTQTADVIEYFTLLKLDAKKTLSIDRIDEFLENYADSIFIPDVLYLKLKLLDEEGMTDEVIQIAKMWINKYATNEHLPEILLILAKNYANQGLIEEATYMYERLFTEYANSKYSYEGMVYLADELYSAGDSKRAFELYKQAFINTKDIEVASLAASRIAQRYLNEGNIKQAVKYYEKLFKANKKYLLKDINSAYELANQLANHEAYDLAIKIGKEIFKKLKLDDNLYEPLLYRLALWNYESKDYKEAKKYIDLYLKELPFGDFAEEIKDLKDKILFQIDDKNTTLMLERFNEIITKYPDTELAKKALDKKIYLLYQLKKYEDVLKLTKQLKDINKTIVINSAKYAVINDLKAKKCNKAIKYYKEFNVTLDKKYDEELYNCAYDVREFNLASRICNKYLLDEDDKIVLKWLKKKAKIYEITSNYKKLALIIDDICNIQKTDCYKFRYKQFFAYYNLNEPKEFLAIASKLIKKDNIKNIDIFMKVVLYAKRQKNTLLTYTYSKKILELQKKYNTYIQSPYIDFVFVDSAKKLNKTKEAIKALKDLVTLKIDDESKARAYYMLASLTANKKYLEKCIKLKNSKTWQPLCKDSLELY